MENYQFMDTGGLCHGSDINFHAIIDPTQRSFENHQNSISGDHFGKKQTYEYADYPLRDSAMRDDFKY